MWKGGKEGIAFFSRVLWKISDFPEVWETYSLHLLLLPCALSYPHPPMHMFKSSNVFHTLAAPSFPYDFLFFFLCFYALFHHNFPISSYDSFLLPTHTCEEPRIVFYLFSWRECFLDTCLVGICSCDRWRSLFVHVTFFSKEHSQAIWCCLEYKFRKHDVSRGCDGKLSQLLCSYCDG